MLQSRVKFAQLQLLSRCWSSSADTEWKTAKPYSEIPGPSTFGLIRAFAPGGKYHNLNAIDLMTSVQNDYGQIAKLPGFLGKRDMVFLFDPKDIETAFRNDGKYPVRRGLETLEYFRGVYKKEWFEKGAGLVPT
jgi:cytochrome P450 family 12